jgi:hypothetical protein
MGGLAREHRLVRNIADGKDRRDIGLHARLHRDEAVIENPDAGRL